MTKAMLSLKTWALIGKSVVGASAIAGGVAGVWALARGPDLEVHSRVFIYELAPQVQERIDGVLKRLDAENLETQMHGLLPKHTDEGNPETDNHELRELQQLIRDQRVDFLDRLGYLGLHLTGDLSDLSSANAIRPYPVPVAAAEVEIRNVGSRVATNVVIDRGTGGDIESALIKRQALSGTFAPIPVEGRRIALGNLAPKEAVHLLLFGSFSEHPGWEKARLTHDDDSFEFELERNTAWPAWLVFSILWTALCALVFGIDMALRRRRAAPSEPQG